MAPRATDHWDNNTYKQLEPYLQELQTSFRAATGYFTISGYDLLRAYLDQVAVQLLVGFDESAKARLRVLLIENIMAHLARWKAENRREAVEDLVRRIRANQFQIVEHQSAGSLDARARQRDHAKVYIFDDRYVFPGSANLTYSGLRSNTENLTLVSDRERAAYYIERFWQYWNDENTVDLTADLLAALLRWLALAPPFHIYLKTVELLVPDEDIEAPRPSYKMPVNYQKVVIERVLRQLKAYRGSLLVASTGLGKTVMATHVALRLQRDRRIDNVLVFSPKQVHPDWERSLSSAGVANRIFTRDLLDRSLKSKGPATRKMEEALEAVDDNFLIIIDESQHFRNSRRMGTGTTRNSFERLKAPIQQRGALVLLLTATPYSKGVEDINNQLLLLPHTGEKVMARASGQMVLSGFVDEDIAPAAWKVWEQDDFFRAFLNLPVATIISTSQVAKDFATATDEGEYIEFGEQRRWLPRVAVTKVKVPVLFEAEMTELFQQKLFLHKPIRFTDRNNNWQFSRVTVQNRIEVDWMSSPAALREGLQQVADGIDKVKYLCSKEARQQAIQPLLDRLQELPPTEDPKLAALLYLLRRYYAEQRKVVIFSERLATAAYLEAAIKRTDRRLAVACTVKRTKKGLEQKDFDKEVLPLIKGFAPVANQDKIGKRDRPKPYDIFVATDAYSTGVNLQDASVVINYDIAWTPDVLIQRAGRILRLWIEPRQVELLTFVGDFRVNQEKRGITHQVERRLLNLRQRSSTAAQISELPILPEGDSAVYHSLGDLSRVKYQEIGEVDPTQLEEFTGVSPFLRHIATLREHAELAATLPLDLSSARHYDGTVQCLFLLLRHEAEHHYLLYTPSRGSFEYPKEDELLDLLACTLDTPVAPVGADEVERIAQRAARQFGREHQLDEDATERICALLLVPRGQRKDHAKLLERVG